MTTTYTKEEVDTMRKETHELITKMQKHMETLATQEDVKEIIRFLKNVDTGVAFVRVSGHLLARIGAFLGSIGAIYLTVKYFFGSLIVHIFK